MANLGSLVPEQVVRWVLEHLPFVELLPAEDARQSDSDSQSTVDEHDHRTSVDDGREETESAHDDADASGPTDSPEHTDDDGTEDQPNGDEEAPTDDGGHTPPPGLAPAIGMFFNGILAAVIRSPTDADVDSNGAEADPTDVEDA